MRAALHPLGFNIAGNVRRIARDPAAEAIFKQKGAQVLGGAFQFLAKAFEVGPVMPSTWTFYPTELGSRFERDSGLPFYA